MPFSVVLKNRWNVSFLDKKNVLKTPSILFTVANVILANDFKNPTHSSSVTDEFAESSGAPSDVVDSGSSGVRRPASGVAGRPSSDSDKGNGNGGERANQVGLIVGVACGVVLALTLIAVAVFWTVCWRQQKERLARKIQLHVMYQQRMQQQVGSK